MEIDFADVRPSVASWLIVGVMAMTFILAGKYLTGRFKVPGLSDLFAAV